MNNDTNDYYLYHGKIYHCSDCTTEAELYSADSSYGYGKTLFFLDKLEGGNYVNADDCVKVKAPDFSLWQRLLIWFYEVRQKIQDLRRPKYDDDYFDDYVPFDDCEF
jgi:hypothetical protein